MSKQATLPEGLTGLVSISGVCWAALVRPTGEVVHCTSTSPEIRVRASMLSAAANLTVQAALRLEIGQFQEFIWEGERGVAVAALVGDAYVVAVAAKGVNLGMLRLALRRLQPGAPASS
jgi:predicted regulator of Ras-like GTPase activity (Roadblock/LC7/MglB family)